MPPVAGGQPVYGPHLPDLADLLQAHAAPWTDPQCPDAEWERLIAESHQTEAAYLARADAEYAAEFAAEFEEAEPEAGP